MSLTQQRTKLFGAAIVVVLVLVVFVNGTCADDALVLPKGFFRFSSEGNFYLPITKRYSPSGRAEDLAIDFNTSLNSNVFPALAPLDPFVPGLPSIGDSRVSFEYLVQTLENNLQYGLTDRISIGVKIPYWWFHNKVRAQVDSGIGSSANVGKNPFFACGSSVCPLFVPGTSRFTTEDVQQLLGRGLDVNGDGRTDIPGFGFKRFQSWNGNGLSDVEAGFRYQYFRTESWRLAFTGGVRFPTGRLDDPDNLTDYAFGTGAYSILYRFNNDFVLSDLWKPKRASNNQRTANATEPGASKPSGTYQYDIREAPGAMEPGDVVLNYTFRYDLVLPQHETKRVPNNVNNPITTNRENVKINVGDYFEYEISALFGIWKGLYASALYKYGFKLQDKVSGSKGFAYSSLEDETKATSHIYIVGLSYSTLPLFIEKKFPLPLNATLTYRNRFDGSNNVLKSQYVGFSLSAVF
jgi:hypothetical protein